MTLRFTALRVLSASTGLLALLILFPSCTRQDDLPTGVQTLTGTLTPVPLSLSRRGTHTLSVEGEDVYLVESAKVDLRDFEGIDIVVTGLVEPNIDPDALPVLVASGVKLTDLIMRTWDIPALKLTLQAPEQWHGTATDTGMTFSQTGSNNVFLEITAESGAVIPDSPTSVNVGGMRGVEYGDAGYDTVYVRAGGTVYIFALAPEVNGVLYVERPVFLRVLQSVRFGRSASSARSSAAPAAGTGSASVSAGAPCGGPAGVLCPSGQYCEVTDPTDGVGRCRSLKR